MTTNRRALGAAAGRVRRDVDVGDGNGASGSGGPHARHEQLVKAIDDVGDYGETLVHIPEDLPPALDRLVARISAARGLTD